MKVIFLILAISVIGIIHAAPTDISENNLGDIVNVNVDAEATITNEVDVTLINILLKWINLELSRVRFENGQPVPPNFPFKNE